MVIKNLKKITYNLKNKDKFSKENFSSSPKLLKFQF